VKSLRGLPPSSALAGPAYRAVMASGAVRLLGRRDRSSAALRRALWSTATGRFAAEERAWIERVEARRGELARSEVAEFAQWASIAPVWGQLLMRIVRELSPRACLELGAGFGISAAYQGAALELNGSGRLTTMERIEGLGKIVSQGVHRLGLGDRVTLRIESADDALEAVLDRIGPIDYAFLDADHTVEGTVAHFTTLQAHLAGGAVVVLDDINWTHGMRRAWAEISGRERVATSVRLRRMGIIVVAPRGDDESASLPRL
jgi:predicted O-methyltransferase YrrM